MNDETSSVDIDIPPSQTLNIHIAMTTTNGTSASSAGKKPINLLRGWPAPSLLPASMLSAASQRLLSNPDIYVPALQYGPDPGYEELREGLARWLARHYAVPAGPDPERICITGGASQSVACIMQSFTDPAVTRAFWVVAPVYHLVCPVFEDSGFKDRMRATPEDEEGIDLEVLEKKIQELEEKEKDLPKAEPYKGHRAGRKIYKHVIYTVSTCSNPSGKTMSLRRREGLVRLARKYDALIISDDVYDFLQWPMSEPGSDSVAPLTLERPPEMRVPRLCDVDAAMGLQDPFGNAISNGSFSKIAGPGMRTGWVEGSKAFAHGLSMTGSSKSGGAPSQYSAAVLSDLVNSGELQKYVEETVRPALQRRHGLMMDAVRKYISPLKPVMREKSLLDSEMKTYGGYFVWMTLDMPVPARVIAEIAQEEENLIVGPGNMFTVLGDEQGVTFDKEIRLCFAWEDEGDLVEGVKRLGDVLHRIRDNKEHYIELAKEKMQGQDYSGFI